jgi:putative cell wall-binding protein
LAASASKLPPAAPKSGPITTASAQATKRTLSSSLRTLADAGGRTKVDVLVITAKGVKPPKSLEMPLRLFLRALPGMDAYTGKVVARDLTKTATTKGVVFVADNGKRTPPPSPEPTKPSQAKITAAAKVKAFKILEATRSGVLKQWAAGFGKNGLRKPGAVLPSLPKSSSDPLAPIKALFGLGTSAGSTSGADPGSKFAAGWFDVRGDHLSANAWAKGHTGKGVRVAVVDEGVDFGHPDLQGTEATVPVVAGPAYAGWPMAYDPYSYTLLAYDQNYGTDYVSSGQSWFSATGATVGVGSAVSFDGATYDTSSLATDLVSKSGTYHIGYLNDANIGAFSLVTGYTKPAVLVSDPNAAGVYDTVFVDLDFNRDFGDDKPCTKGLGDAPISYLDFWNSAANAPGPDGYADVSGGMVYWIADGQHAPPGYEAAFGSLVTTPGAGTMVAFMGAMDLSADHGTLCASNVSAQGVINGPGLDSGGTSSTVGYPSFKQTPQGMVQGGGKDVGLVAIGDMYNNFTSSAMLSWDFAAYGPDGVANSGDEVQVVSNSFGTSDEYNDEWDLMSRYMVALNQGLEVPGADPPISMPAAVHTTFLVSTGNGAPGYGTVTPPRPTTGIGVGASTQYGSTGYPVDSIDATDQITYGDVAPFSNRGPSGMGHTGVDIVADGSLASGDEPLNLVGDGWIAWVNWAGTSRSCPVASGNLALAYQAYADAHSGAWPTYVQAKQFLMNGAIDCNYDTFVQGAGRVDAERTADLAAGAAGVSVDPPAWTPGDWQGTKYPAYASVLSPGETDTTTLTVTNNASTTTTVSVTGEMYQRTKTETFTVTLDPARESPYTFGRPDYLREVTGDIPSGTDLAVFRVRTPLAQIDPSGAIGTSGAAINGLRVLAYDWKDVNHDGKLWTDANHNGFVNDGEIEPNEYMRFTYANNDGPTTEVRVQTPLARMHTGVWFGLQHSQRLGNPLTVTVEMSCWKRAASDMLTVGTAMPVSLSAHGSSTVAVSARAPSAIGVYEGQFRVSTAATTTVVPVTVNVAAAGATFSFGGTADTTTSLMPDGALFGDQDWSWRPESGDGRFFMTDVPSSTPLPAGSKWVVHTSWDTTPTDIDTLLYGPADTIFHADSAFNAFAGSNDLVSTGGSANTNVGAGLWLFNTATGGPDEWVTGDLNPGLNQIFLHQVISDGASVATTFSGETGVMSIDPSQTGATTRAVSGSVGIDLSTGLAMTGFGGRGWGMTPVFDRIEAITQNGTWTHDFPVADCGYIDLKTFNDTSDIDLYLRRYDTASSMWVLVASSAGATGNEAIKVVSPADGLYRAEVDGFSVTGGQDTFRVRLADPQGNGLGVSVTPTGTISAGTTMAATADWTVPRGTVDERDATFEGVAGFGPGSAKQLLTSVVDVSYPFEVFSSSPASGGLLPLGQPVEVTLSRRADSSTVDASSAWITPSGSVTVIPGAVSWDDANAKIIIAASLARDTAYTVHLTSSIKAVDGTPLPGSLIGFRTVAQQVERIAGSDRFDTAVKVSRSAFPTSSAAVVLASGETFPDALSASGLCGAADAPLLLTTKSLVPATVTAEIHRLMPAPHGLHTVWIVGGTGSVSSAVFDELNADGYDVQRVAGADRYATAVAVAGKIRDLLGPTATQRALVARGDAYPDAMTASALAVSQKIPILFTRSSSLPPVTDAALSDLGVAHAWVFGGTGAVSTSVATRIGTITGHAPTRWGGANRYATAVVAANGAAALSWVDWHYIGMATGKNYPDGLAGGVAAGRNTGPLLLTEPTRVPAEVTGVITAHKAAIDVIAIYGGTAAVSQGVQDYLQNLILH